MNAKRLLPILGIAGLAGLGVGADCGGGEPWRSSLYPESWTPSTTDAQGRFLHDFSYAGYHYGEDPLPASIPGAVYDVTSYGADPTGTVDSTAAIQAALDDAGGAGGGTVLVPAGLYRCDGLLTVNDPGVVLAGEGSSASRIYFTAVEGMSDKGHITFRGVNSLAGEVALAEDGANRSFTLALADASSLAPGDEIAVGWVITDDFVERHNMTGTWYSFNGQWKPFFLRTITDVDLGSSPNTVTLDIPLRYDALLSDSASVRVDTGYLSECGVQSLGLSTAVDYQQAWEEVRTHAILMDRVKDCWVRDVESFDSPYVADDLHLQNGGIKILRSKRVTVADTRMEKAQNRGGGGSGYLFEVQKSNEILTRDSVGLAGRHNFIQNWDFGTTGTVWLRITSDEGKCLLGSGSQLGNPCYSEFHHSLAMANLIDQSVIGDGWNAANRNDYSSGAGITATESVLWNTSGGGRIGSWQFGWGYVIGTEDMNVITGDYFDNDDGTEPYDFTEGLDEGDLLEPPSLYEDQLARRLAR